MVFVHPIPSTLQKHMLFAPPIPKTLPLCRVGGGGKKKTKNIYNQSKKQVRGPLVAPKLSARHEEFDFDNESP